MTLIVINNTPTKEKGAHTSQMNFVGLNLSLTVRITIIASQLLLLARL